MASPAGVRASLGAGARVAVRAPVAPLHGEPRVSSPQVSQRLAGHALTVLGAEGDWLRVRGEDRYEGWVHRGYVTPAGDTVTGAADDRLLSLGCFARVPGGPGRLLPLGAFLARGERAQAGEAIPEEERARRFPRAPDAICASAVTLFEGTSYEWGGVTPWGADCSGLVQSVFWLHGAQLERDAWQQAVMGRDAGDLRGAEPADLLFFSDSPGGRPSHVGIALGGERMVHLGLGRGGYAVERLDDEGDEYVRGLRSRLSCIRRLL